MTIINYLTQTGTPYTREISENELRDICKRNNEELEHMIYLTQLQLKRFYQKCKDFKKNEHILADITKLFDEFDVYGKDNTEEGGFIITLDVQGNIPHIRRSSVVTHISKTN